MISEENYYDHYKDSFELQKGYIAKRDHYTIALLAMVMVLCLQISDANIVNKSVNSIIQKEINNRILIDFKYISVFLSYIFLWLIIQYYQICLTIEKTYLYINSIEKKLSNNGDFKIEREGVDYLKSYPWLKSLTHRIYIIVFPLLFATVASIRAYNEVVHLLYKNGFSCVSLLSFIAYALNFTVSILYISNRWFHEEAFSKDVFPNIKFTHRLRLYFGINGK